MVRDAHFDNLHTNLSLVKFDCSKLAIIVALLEQNLAVHFKRPTERGTSAIIKTIESKEEYRQIIETIQTLIMEVNIEHNLPYPPYCENYISEMWKVWKGKDMNCNENNLLF